MPVTVRPASRIGQYPADVQVTRFVDVFAREAGLSPQMARKRLYDVPRVVDLASAAVRAYRHLNLTVELQRFLTVLLAGGTAPVLTKELQVTAEAADANESMAEVAFHLNPCRETAEHWVRALDGEIARQTELRHALVAKWGVA